MALKFYLGIRTSPGSFKRVAVNDINSNAKVGDLKVEAGKVTNLPMESLELAYCGNILEDDLSVTDSGLKSGVTVHVLRKHIPNDTSKQSEPMSETQIKAISQAFRTISLDPAFRNALQMMKQPSHIENLLMITPALLNDPVAIAIIQDPELIVRMADFATAKRMAELHPALTETANHIAGAVQSESTQRSAPSLNYSDNNYAYAMDDFSDEEEMDSSQSSDSIAGNSSRGMRGPITAPQLAAALASATGGLASVPGPSGSSDNPQASTSSGQSSSSAASVITPEMLQSAIAASLTPPANSSPMLTPPSWGHNNRAQMQQQIQQMHDVGLQDDVVNLHALAITGGDVQAAINLVLSGVISVEDNF